MDRPTVLKKRNVPDGKTAKWDALDREAAEWFATPQEGNEEWRKAEEVRLLNEIVKLVPPYFLDGLTVFWEMDWPKFDATLGPLSKFVRTRLKRCAQAVGREDRNERRVQVEDQAAGKPKVVWMSRADSLNATTEFGERGDTIADPRARRPQEDIFSGMLLLATAVQLRQRLSDLPGKQSRYFPLFLTGDVTDQAQRDALPGVDRHDELQLFSALHLPFLDFFMLRVCRTLKELACTSLKPYGTFVEGKEMETPLPLPNAVYIAYLSEEEHDPVSSSAISRQHEAYRAFVRDLGIF